MANLLRTIFEMQHRGSGATDPSGTSAGPSGDLRAVQELASNLQRLGQQGVQTYSELSRSSQNWSLAATRATTQAISLLAHQNLLETQSVATHRLAEQAKSASSLGALKQTAVYKAIAATAAGFGALGELNFWAAAQDFASAALWGTIAGAQIAASAGAGSHSSRSLSEHYVHSLGSGPERNVGALAPSLAAGAASAAHPPSGQLTVSIMGDEQAGQWLADTLNTAVQQRGVQLTASSAIRPTYAAG
ncbi:MAG TPA: hypothetical protein VKV79_03125 [Terriglobia bacterium]|nr:hypothetical protein [Terriglobia bacterium]